MVGNAKMLWKLTAIGTAMQLAMIGIGHYNEFVRINLFAALGMAISLVVGAMYGRMCAITKKDAAVGGMAAGGLCAIIGIAASVALGDVPANVLVFGTVGSAAAGLLGGLALRAMSRSVVRPA